MVWRRSERNANRRLGAAGSLPRPNAGSRRAVWGRSRQFLRETKLIVVVFLRERNRKEKGKLRDFKTGLDGGQSKQGCEEVGGGAEKMSSGRQWPPELDQVAFEEVLQIPLGGALAPADLQNFQKLL